jgi:hypothetical protein
VPRGWHRRPRGVFKAILPDPLADAYRPVCVLLRRLARKIRALTPPADVEQVLADPAGRTTSSAGRGC